MKWDFESVQICLCQNHTIVLVIMCKAPFVAEYVHRIGCALHLHHRNDERCSTEMTLYTACRTTTITLQGAQMWLGMQDYNFNLKTKQSWINKITKRQTAHKRTYELICWQGWLQHTHYLNKHANNHHIVEKNYKPQDKTCVHAESHMQLWPSHVIFNQSKKVTHAWAHGRRDTKEELRCNVQKMWYPKKSKLRTWDLKVLRAEHTPDTTSPRNCRTCQRWNSPSFATQFINA